MDINAVALRSFDPFNNWLRIEASPGQAGTHTPNDANQVFRSVFDVDNNALRVICLSGCGGGSITFGTDISAIDVTHQKVVGFNSIPLSTTMPAPGQVYQYSSAQSQWVPTTVVNATRNINTSGPLAGGGNLSTDLTLGFATQSAATVLAGPATGSGAPTFRALQTSDLPVLPVPGAATLGGAKTVDCTGTGHILKLDSTGTFTCSADSGGGVTFGTDINPIDATHQKVTGLQTIPIASTVPSSGQCLSYNGIQWAPAACGTGSPGGTDTAVQFNSSGGFSGDSANFSYNTATHSLMVTGSITASNFLGTGTTAGCVQLNESQANGSSYDQLCAPTSLASNVTWVLPAADGGPSQVLQTSGNGILSWTNVNPLITVANASAIGTTLNTLTKLTGAPATAVIATTGDTGGIVGITTSGAGSSGNAVITTAGQVNCVFDGATVAGDYVQISGSVAGNCHDTSSTFPTSGQVIGRVLSTNASGGSYTLDLFSSEIKAVASASSPTVNYWHTPTSDTAASTQGANNQYFWTISIPTTTTFSSIYWYVNTSDSSANHYDIGLGGCPSNDCSQPGVAVTLICDTGPLTGGAGNPYGSNGAKSHACVQSTPITIQPGTYMVLFTADSTAGKWGGAGTIELPFSAANLGSTAGGQLVNATTPSAGTVATTAGAPGIALH